MIKLDVQIDNDPIEIVAEASEESVDLDAETSYEISTDNYNNLSNIPTLNGRPIKGDISEEDPTVPNWAKAVTPGDGITPDSINAVGASDSLSLSDLSTLWDSL